MNEYKFSLKKFQDAGIKAEVGKQLVLDLNNGKKANARVKKVEKEKDTVIVETANKI